MSGQGEFDYIRDSLRPLTLNDPAALDLQDDAAILTPSAGCELIVSTDTLVEGTHFLASDSAGVVAGRAVRTTLSDIAAMGACPRGLFCSVSWRSSANSADRQAFAVALLDEVESFSVPVLGGDTTSGAAQWTISLTALGEAPVGTALRRTGAKPGDDIWVSGTIGDAALGLDMARGVLDEQAHLRKRYERPEPRLALGQALRGLASACLDVSDGLVADAGHIAQASEVLLEIEAMMVPLSDPALLWLEKEGTAGLMRLLSAGDDYELLFTAPHDRASDILALQAETGTPVTWIGQVQSGEGVRVRDEDGVPLVFDTRGFTHF